MKMYLSSFRLGNNSKRLAELMEPAKNIGYVANAGDYSNRDVERSNQINAKDMSDLKSLGLHVEELNLKDYFGKTDRLRAKLNTLGALFFRGGNTFILRQAMRLSGFDQIFEELKRRKDFVYSGYSAGIAVLAPSLHGVELVDDPDDKPYPELAEPIWEGLGFLDYLIVPHYKSNHPESLLMEKVVDYCETHGITFRTLRDGEVIIIE
jgi:dipeptidase E